MLRRLSQRERFEAIVAEWSPKIQKAFEDSLDGLVAAIVLKPIVNRLKEGDIAGAIDLMNIEAAAFNPLDEAIRAVFVAGGLAAVDTMPVIRDPNGRRLVPRWDSRSEAAQAWLNTHSAEVIGAIVGVMVEIARSALFTALARGEDPLQAVLRLIGRLNRASGKRAGGTLALSGPQAVFVATARQELIAGDYAAYLDRKRRDKRFDKLVKEAKEQGKPIPAPQIDAIVGAYAGRLQQLRSKVLGEDQTFAALAGAFFAAFSMQSGRGLSLTQFITKTWRHTAGQRHPREQHISMAGQTVTITEDFIAPDGTRISYPHASGLPASHRVNCRCFTEYRFNFTATRTP